MSQVKHDPAVNTVSQPAAAPISQQPAVNWQMMVDMHNSRCTHQHTRQERKYKQSAFAWACVLFWFASPLCSWIPFCFDGLKTSTTYCRHCNQQLSSTDNNSKTTTAHVVLSLCLLVGLGLTVFVIYYYYPIIISRRSNQR